MSGGSFGKLLWGGWGHERDLVWRVTVMFGKRWGREYKGGVRMVAEGAGCGLHERSESPMCRSAVIKTNFKTKLFFKTETRI